jgi:hypothetical protein
MTGKEQGSEALGKLKAQRPLGSSRFTESTRSASVRALPTLDSETGAAPLHEDGAVAPARIATAKADEQTMENQVHSRGMGGRPLGECR